MITRKFFSEWKNATLSRRHSLVWKKWAREAKILEYRSREVKLRECRAALAAQFLLSQPQFKRPNFQIFTKQLRPVEVDEPPPKQVINETMNETEIKVPPAEEEITIERAAPVQDQETVESPPVSPRSRRIIRKHTSEQATEPIEHEESFWEKNIKKVNVPNVLLTLGIVFLLSFFTYHIVRFVFARLGYFDRYQQYLFNETMPPYNKHYDVDFVINYSEILDNKKDLSIDSILKQMSKEITAMKRKQTEMSDQIDQMHNALLQEEL